MSYAWQALPAQPKTKAHAIGIGWMRALCGLRLLNTGPWHVDEARPKCGACLRRVKNARYWMEVLK